MRKVYNKIVRGTISFHFYFYNLSTYPPSQLRPYTIYTTICLESTQEQYTNSSLPQLLLLPVLFRAITAIELLEHKNVMMRESIEINHRKTGDRAITCTQLTLNYNFMSFTPLFLVKHIASTN